MDKFSSVEVQFLEDVFKYFDKENKGTLDSRDLAEALRTAGSLVTEKEAISLRKKYDPEQVGVLDLRYWFFEFC
ncbi:unnamed protein product [Moneuplotes crassus]|uniref:EF-hand domain-containing protein n=1 Tax=Euplotes crassus TaxID=5936 RepID=A0AAD1XXU1_EUPCR|nr:unnamed protein product [Moneuplotes crassus]